MKNLKESNSVKIQKLLKKNKRVTRKELQFVTNRLGAIIKDLHLAGWKFAEIKSKKGDCIFHGYFSDDKKDFIYPLTAMPK